MIMILLGSGEENFLVYKIIIFGFLGKKKFSRGIWFYNFKKVFKFVVSLNGFSFIY